MAASSSSSNPGKNYEVFLSFRGEDTRYNFTSHLHAALCRKKIKTYIDNNLSRGEEISTGLRSAIEESRIAVVVFSKNYADSRWCLEELLHILQCRKNYEQVVIPIFYHVDPSDVRKQQGTYEKAFQNHRECFKDDPDKVRKWVCALAEAGNLSGWTVPDDRLESELLEELVEDIIKRLNGTSSFFVDSENLVGIEQPVKQIESLLQIGLLDVRIIGLWGKGGIGKTTLARFMFGKLYRDFNGHCFLDNVREEWEKCQGNYHLKNKLFSNLLGEKEANMGIGFLVPTSWKDRLIQTKSLIVLDDVNEREQLEILVGCREWFGPGSRIIVTSRDVQFLQRHLVDAIYEVKGLNSDEARQLFCLNAFNRNFHAPYPTELLERVVHYAEGIPLVINVLRSLFNDNGKENWETLLDKLKNSRAGKKIQRALMISYKDLNHSQKKVFLDIASFFKGWKRHHVEEILEEYGFSVESAINDLVNKSLITINYEKELCMHDLVQEMGRKVIQKQSPEPGKHSRLWDARDISDVFKSNTATQEIEGIFLDISKIQEVHLKPDVFRLTNNLRLLKIYDSTRFFVGGKHCKVKLPEGLQSLPDKLQYLHWEAYPAKSLPSNFAPEKLVKLIMTHSKLERLWDGVQNLGSLKTINLSRSDLIEVPDLSGAPNLEKINLVCCPRLLHVPSHKFQNLKRLVSLNMSFCTKLQVLPDSIPSAIYLSFFCCYNLKKLPEIKKENVISLWLKENEIEELPASIWSSYNLEMLCLKGSKCLQTLPTSICKLKFLRKLDLSGCSKFEKFPDILEPMQYLVKLDLSGTAIRALPPSIENLIELQVLNLRLCEKLEFVPGNIDKVKILEMLNLSGTSKLLKSPSLIVGRFFNSRTLHLLDCNISEFPHNWHSCFELVEDLFLSIKNLDAIPASVAVFSNLQYLNISKWKNLRSLPEFPCYLKYLEAEGCTSLESVSSSRNAIMQDFHNRMKLNFGTNHMSFLNCLKLDQNARDNIIADGWLRILRTAIHTSLRLGGYRQSCTYYPISEIPKWYHHQHCTCYLERFHHQSCTCYPGSEIPEWFDHQETGSSINIKLPSNWWVGGFMGFSICLVTAFSEYKNFFLSLGFDIEVQFKTNSGKIYKLEDHRIRHAYDNRQRSRISVSSDHVFMLYESTSFYEVWKAEGIVTAISFHFHPTDGCGTMRLESCGVKRCGIRLLYLQDEKLGVSIPPDYWTPKAESYRKRRTINGNANPCSSEVLLCESATEIEKGQGKRKKINRNANSYWSGIVVHDSATEKEGNHRLTNKSGISESGFAIGSGSPDRPVLVSKELSMVTHLAECSLEEHDFKLLFKPEFLQIYGLPPYAVERKQRRRMWARRKATRRPTKALSQPRRLASHDKPSTSGHQDLNLIVEPSSFSGSQSFIDMLRFTHLSPHNHPSALEHAPQAASPQNKRHHPASPSRGLSERPLAPPALPVPVPLEDAPRSSSPFPSKLINSLIEYHMALVHPSLVDCVYNSSGDDLFQCSAMYSLSSTINGVRALQESSVVSAVSTKKMNHIISLEAELQKCRVDLQESQAALAVESRKKDEALSQKDALERSIFKKVAAARAEAKEQAVQEWTSSATYKEMNNSSYDQGVQDLLYTLWCSHPDFNFSIFGEKAVLEVAAFANSERELAATIERDVRENSRDAEVPSEGQQEP